MVSFLLQSFLYIYIYHSLESRSTSSSRNQSRRSSTASLARNQNPTDQLLLKEENEPVKPDPLALPPMTDEEYAAIYTEETRAKAIVLLIYFSILIFAVPLASMYFCYYHVFNGMYTSYHHILLSF